MAALRSFPRRFRAAVALHDDEDDGVLDRLGPDGSSAAEHLDAAARGLALLGRAVEQALVEREPVLPAAVLDPQQRSFTAEPLGVAAALDLLDLEASALADRAAGVEPAEWARPATLSGSGARVAALDVLREAVRSTAAHLRATEQAVATARR